MKAHIAVIAGDGIGPEVTAEAVRVLEAVAKRANHSIELTPAAFGGAAIDLCGDPLPEATLNLCLRADAVLLGAIGGPKWSSPQAKVRPEQGLLGLRKAMGVYANLRNALKAWLVVEVNQGNAATVALTLLQATTVGGAGSKAISNAVPVWLNNATATSDALVAQAAALGYTTDATLADKLVIFEIIPEDTLDQVNGFNHVSVSTGASNAANITGARLHIYGSYQGATVPTTIA